MDKALVHNSDWQERTAEHWEPKKPGFTNRFPGDKHKNKLPWNSGMTQPTPGNSTNIRR